MNTRRIFVLPASLLLAVMTSNAAERGALIRIKILDVESRSTSIDGSGVPKNCDLTNYDAYCNSSRTTQVTNTLLAQEDDRPPFRIACAVDSKWSKCIALPAGETFDAYRDKRGLIVYFEDDKGKPRKQLYALVDAGAVIPAPVEKAQQPSPQHPTAPQRTSLSDAEDALRAAVSPPPKPAGTVKCTFLSAPPGAEITLDGHYVGSTPSVLNLATGAHGVSISMPGFAHWSRELTVSPGAELTVNAVLEKTQ
jgi:hypothetical protein